MASGGAHRAATLSAAERREAGMQAELYSILVATEHLEQAFVRGSVSNEDYERNCKQSLAQFKTLQNGLGVKCPDVRTWARVLGLNCPLAEERLLGSGVAATTLFNTDVRQGAESLACFKASEGFITLSDALRMNLTAIDDVLPLVRDLQSSIVAIPDLPPLAGLDRIAGWLVTLNGMRAADRLDDDQCRQRSMDVEQAYTAMKKWLQEKL
jgi:ESCRT-I complex subunit VPS28